MGFLSRVAWKVGRSGFGGLAGSGSASVSSPRETPGATERNSPQTLKPKLVLIQTRRYHGQIKLCLPSGFSNCCKSSCERDNQARHLSARGPGVSLGTW